LNSCPSLSADRQAAGGHPAESGANKHGAWGMEHGAWGMGHGASTITTCLQIWTSLAESGVSDC